MSDPLPLPPETSSESPDFELDDDAGRVDIAALWRFLSEDAYWARHRTRSDVERQVAGAWRVVGAYEVLADRRSGPMIGFARAVSDGVSMAYLADVYVEADWRGRGVAAAILDAMIDGGPGAGFRWMLHTRDAHGLYRKFGFAEPDDRYLERPGTLRPGV